MLFELNGHKQHLNLNYPFNLFYHIVYIQRVTTGEETDRSQTDLCMLFLEKWPYTTPLYRKTLHFIPGGPCHCSAFFGKPAHPACPKTSFCLTGASPASGLGLVRPACAVLLPRPVHN